MFQVRCIIELISDVDGSIFLIVPTGTEKSLPYLLVTKEEEVKISVIIVPSLNLIKRIEEDLTKINYESLILCSTVPKDKRRRLISKGIESVHTFIKEYDCIGTTPEQFYDPDVQSLINILYSNNFLARFILDKAHVLLQCGCNFRRAYSNIYRSIKSCRRC
uniref:Helicase ATP-binding domain-containing protein n=1 Tax=Strongyloides venezuelensis TaxID=75913 RepID=A0A0K0FQ48_STRVS